MLSYAALVYHLPLLIAFSVSQNTSFVWGGCMLFPAAHMVNDTYGIMQVRPCFLVASGECMIWHMLNDTCGIMQVRPRFPVASINQYVTDVLGGNWDPTDKKFGSVNSRQDLLPTCKASPKEASKVCMLWHMTSCKASC